MDFSRRALLTTLPASALLSVAAPARSPAAAPGVDDHDRILSNTLAILTGTPESNAHPEVAARLADIASTAQRHLTAMDQAAPGELFPNLPLGTSDPNLHTTYRYLYEIALATPSPATQRRVIDALAQLHDTYYGDQSRGYYGNWFTWEIGISTHVTKALILLRDELATHHPTLTATYLASMDAYLRNGKDGDVDLDSRFHTGANLADITTNRILQGALTGDGARVTKAVADQLTVYATVEEGDGFHADGSFIQHESVAYTGAYGKNLLTRAVQTLKLLHGTGFVPATPLAPVIQGWITHSFAPVIFEGWLMEIVKGRTVSRPQTGYADVSTIVEAITDLSSHTSDQDAHVLKSYAKSLAQVSPSPPDPKDFVSPVTIAAYADILADPTIPAQDLVPREHHAAFNAMDRTVHRRPGYAFALARSSRRISKYEYMNGENLTPWFQGDGAHYLYLTGQDQSQAFGVDHFTTVSPYHLAGVTAPVEPRRTIPDLYGAPWYDNPEAGFTASSTRQNQYVYFPLATNTHSGGAHLGPYGTSSLVLGDDAAHAARHELPPDFVTYANARATKSWFMFDDEIVILTANVHDPLSRPLTTTLDTRITDPSDTATVTGRRHDGTPWTGSGSPAWLRYTAPGHSLGYVFLTPAETAVTLDTVSHSRRRIRTANADTRVTKRVFSLTVRQPAGSPPQSLAHALVPHATEAQLAAYTDGPLTVLANNPRLQAVAHRGLSLLMANTFTPGPHHIVDLTIDGPASVLLRTHPDNTHTLALSDPTTARPTLSVTLHDQWLFLVEPQPGIRVHRTACGTRVEATTHRTHGRSVTALLR
ncbi:MULTISPECIES: polysaccharide lyase family 8 super-sandwich domain-containing protein [unclassified Streptomyces]|uniref:polysaccharide lyase family 8 super-sandwich domain-containing protein n=1 Tax=unclassified Streptomyces TaxID=2593676 RepID=UPI00190871FC|nr:MULTISPECIES: polysaccharide lyase family 8 super-sandwich domain-containing protein [unclassified Streptomyces]MCU4748094.1 polysaccharide lyase beta-sandwich domain-containing protein [Streptomyces sp. G-5]QQN78694.1 silent information regulator protein Sir2 [Streptomyces sp. XC 2026]